MSDEKNQAVGDGIQVENASWTFGNGVASNFSSHVSRSVPLYNDGHGLICELSDFFIKNDSICYDIGTSVGELILKLANRHKSKPNVRWVGIDVEEEMISKAKENKNSLDNVDFIVSDILEFPFLGADLIISYYTIQFTRPKERQEIFNKIYNSLNWGGAFLLFEKVRAPDARFQDIMTQIYNEFKLNQGFNSEEIISKSRSLKGVLEPFSSQANIDLLKRAGFQDVMSIMKYVCFEGFLAIK